MNTTSDHDTILGRTTSNTGPTLAIATAAPLAPVSSGPEHDHNVSIDTSNYNSRQTLVGNEKQQQWHPSIQSPGHSPEKTIDDTLHRSSTSTSTSTLTNPNLNSLTNPISRISTDPLGNTYPEGGLSAYLVTLGSFCGCLISLGLMNTLSTYAAYVSTHQLSHLPASRTGWIFGLYAFLSFFLGLQIGPLFDAYGPRYLVLPGSICILLCYILLAECTEFWHFMLVFGVLGGTGTSLVFTPSIAAIGHWFYLRRGTFTGLACVGGSLGGIIFPLTLQALFDKPGIGWPWAQRIIALINLPLAIIANLCIRSRLPPRRPVQRAQIMPDPRIFRDKTFALVTMAVFFVEWGLFVPITYLTNFALDIGVDRQLSYQLIAVFNAGSCLGRWLPGLIADRVGRFNAMIITTVICWVGTFAFWLPSEMLIGASESARLALLIVFSVVFGFGSGSGISLIPVCVGQLCRTEEYGRYYATCYTVVSFATLTGIPLAGGIVGQTEGGRYWGLIVFTGLSYTVGTTVFVMAKGVKVGFGRRILTERF